MHEPKKGLCVCCSRVFTRPHRDTARRHRELWFTPLQLLKRGQPRGRKIAPAYYDGMNITHTHTQPYTHTWIYTQKLSVKPIPPNGHSLILLTGAQGGNEVCHLYIHDPWLTPLPHSPPPSWPGNGTLLGWDGGDRNRDWDSVWMESSDTNTSMLSTQISPQMGSKPVLSHLFWYLPPPLLSLTLSHTHNC